MKVDFSVRAALIVAAAGGLYYVAKRYGHLLNPASPDNVANQGVTAAVTAATGRPETLGGWLYDVTHPDPMKKSQQMTNDALAAKAEASRVKSPMEVFVDNLTAVGGGVI